MYRLLILVFIVALSGCAWNQPQHSDNYATVVLKREQGRPEQLEVDNIYTLLAFAVVYKDWQESREAKHRGHNIGSVLVDKAGQPVFWARNANGVTKNGSQHGEVRLIHNYLNCSSDKYLDGYTVYTTLEPCAMCAGMMSLTKLSRTVYGQKDPAFGDALERLALDSRHHGHGYSPYPRLFQSIQSETPFTTRLNQAFANFDNDNITEFLLSEDVKFIFQQANDQLANMPLGNLKTKLGRDALISARAFLVGVSNEYVSEVGSLCQ